MNTLRYRNTLIAVGIAAALSIGAVGCSKTPDNSSKQAASSQVVTDTAITTGVKAKLALDRDLDSSDISVSTVNGLVTLTGSVKSTGARSAAEAATRSFSGVTNVSNRLSVPSPTAAEAAKNTGEAAGQAMSDTWITTKVKSVLLADSDAKGLDVKVDTKDGVVSLEGVLATQKAVDHVKKLAGDVEGVKRVNANLLTVARS